MKTFIRPCLHLRFTTATEADHESTPGESNAFPSIANYRFVTDTRIDKPVVGMASPPARVWGSVRPKSTGLESRERFGGRNRGLQNPSDVWTIVRLIMALVRPLLKTISVVMMEGKISEGSPGCRHAQCKESDLRGLA